MAAILEAVLPTLKDGQNLSISELSLTESLLYQIDDLTKAVKDTLGEGVLELRDNNETPIALPDKKGRLPEFDATLKIRLDALDQIKLLDQVLEFE